MSGKVPTPAIVIAPKQTDVPAWALQYPGWVTWTTTEQKAGGRYSKIPTTANGQNCNAHDLKNHRSVTAVLATFKRVHGTPKSLLFEEAKGKIAGIALDLPNVPTPFSYASDGAPLYLVALDFDNVKGSPVNKGKVNTALALLPSQYREVSPSGTGLRVLVLCRHLVPAYNLDGFEVYSKGRFMTITLRGTGEPTEICVDVLNQIKAMYPGPQSAAPTSTIPPALAQADERTGINADVLGSTHPPSTLDKLAAMLASLPTSKDQGCDNSYWFKIVSAARDGWGTTPDVRQIVRAWCLRTPAEFDEDEFDKLWDRAPRIGANNTGVGTIVFEARQRGYTSTSAPTGPSTSNCWEPFDATAAVSSPANASRATGQSGPNTLSKNSIVLKCGADLTPEPVQWLWQDWFALGKFHLLAGAPGQGKTTIAMACAATVTIGGRWPDRSRCIQGNVLIWSGEDDYTDTLLPRLIAAGADRSKVYFVDGTQVGSAVRPFDPATDTTILQDAIEQIGSVSLIIIDPVSTAVAGDSHKNTEVRRGLQPLVDLAANINAALLGITHLSKGGQGTDPAQRVIGSIAFTAVARVVLVAARVKTEGGAEKRILARGKSNIGPDNGGFEYHLAQVEALPGIQASRVEWGQSVAGSALELMTDAVPDTDSDHADAASLLQAELNTSTWTSSDLATKPLRDAGFSKKQIYTASKKLRVIRQKLSMSGGWDWRLPMANQVNSPRHEDSPAPEGSQDALSQTLEPSAPSGESSAENALLGELDALMMPGRQLQRSGAQDAP
jgi:putative DNA primase/helicase